MQLLRGRWREKTVWPWRPILGWSNYEKLEKTRSRFSWKNLPVEKVASEHLNFCFINEVTTFAEICYGNHTKYIVRKGSLPKCLCVSWPPVLVRTIQRESTIKKLMSEPKPHTEAKLLYWVTGQQWDNETYKKAPTRPTQNGPKNCKS